MLSLLLNGEYQVFGIVLVAIILSLSLHEFGHAASATVLGDRTPGLAGRLTLNPGAHIDLMGLAMVVLVGFGYAKPVPFNPRNIRHAWGSAAVAAAGPAMNLLLAVVAINAYVFFARSGSIAPDSSAAFSLLIMAQINLLLMLFNLIPLGPLDGHYIMSWFLPPRLGYQYDQFNARYGNMVFMALIVLSIAGVPVFRVVTSFAGTLMPYLTFV
ncbi:site-2 protease family protein [Permianibacter sp. IMCC34836]|uniref:site-2 protease family protein n=1 Tax=Permianibacter fluminis TaxID=2738515 RepID=UPI001553BC98|nr:site-2 protease family protein [Permianibacter fluminis]NQD36784.1 site-2 protease family protein [Permianibacter fluminis]